MAALTWRNVDTPNLAPAIQGFQQFSELLDKGLSGAQEALTTFDKTKTDRVSNEFIQNILTNYAGTPDQLNADMQSGALFEGVDRERLNPAAMDLLARRPEDLLRYATGAQGLADATADTAFEATDRGWKIQDRNDLDQAKPQMARMLAAANGPNPEAAIAAIRADPAYMAAVGKLDPTIQASMAKAPIEIIQNILGLTTTRNEHVAQADAHTAAVFDIETGRWDFSAKKEDRNNETLAAGVVQQIGLIAPDENVARSMLTSANLNPRAFSLAVSQLSGQFPGIVGMTAPSGNGGGVDGSGSGSTTSLGYDQFRTALESGGDPSAYNKLSGASGVDQFMPETWMSLVTREKPAWATGLSREQILAQRGNPARSAEMEGVLRADNTRYLRNAGVPVNNASLYAMHHFSPQTAVKFLKAGDNVPTSQIFSADVIADNPYLARKTKGQVMQNWAQRSGDQSIIGGLGADTTAPGVISATIRQGQNENATVADEWAAAAADKRKLPVVVTALLAGTFKGENAEYVADQLRTVMDRTGGNAAQAAAILEDSVDPSGKVPFRMSDILPRWLTGQPSSTSTSGMRLNPTRVDRAADTVRTGAILTEATGLDRGNRAIQQIAGARQSYDQANAAYDQAAAAVARGDLRYKTRLPQLAATRNAALQQLRMVEAAQAEDTTLNMNAPDRPVAPSNNPNGTTVLDLGSLFKVRNVR